MHFAIVECGNPACRLRFPRTEQDRPVRACPRCGGDVRVAAESETNDETGAARAVLPLDLLLDNIRSAFNVGSILRSADAAGVRTVHLCGITPTPEHPRVARTALGAERSVGWKAWSNALEAAATQRAAGATLWALEEQRNAVSLFDVDLPDASLLLMAGSEVTGLDPGLLVLADRVVCLPMRGVKRSLNVAVACGIATVLIADRLAARPSTR